MVRSSQFSITKMHVEGFILFCVYVCVHGCTQDIVAWQYFCNTSTMSLPPPVMLQVKLTCSNSLHWENVFPSAYCVPCFCQCNELFTKIKWRNLFLNKRKLPKCLNITEIMFGSIWPSCKSICLKKHFLFYFLTSILLFFSSLQKPLKIRVRHTGAPYI